MTHSDVRLLCRIAGKLFHGKQHFKHENFKMFEMKFGCLFFISTH